MITALDPAQISIPRGRERESRDASEKRLWLALPDGRQLHLGVERPFRQSGKTHPAFANDALDVLARSLEENGYPANWEDALAPRRRFYSEDPFGNRLEFIEPLEPSRHFGS